MMLSLALWLTWLLWPSIYYRLALVLSRVDVVMVLIVIVLLVRVRIFSLIVVLSLVLAMVMLSLGCVHGVVYVGGMCGCIGVRYIDRVVV